MPLAVSDLNLDLSGKIVLDRKIGAGGMAIVFHGRDLINDREIALKLLRPEIAQGIGTERFLREIQIAARLNHPNILPLFESGVVAGIPYYVMPFIDGSSLRQLLETKGALGIDEALAITYAVGHALEYAHSQGIVHRDIKPDNVLLAAGHAVVADFGIAKAVGDAATSRLTESQFVIGTPAYMSPEQGEGSKTLDGRSDEYSLACVLYEMLAGEPPFRGPTPQAIQARKTFDPVPPIRTLRKRVPQYLEQAIVTALAPNRADRFPSVAAFCAALQSERPDKRKVRPAVYVIGGVVLLGAAIGAGFLLSKSGPAPGGRRRIVTAQFVNRSPDPTLSSLGFMAADWITAGLLEAGSLEVVPSAAALDAARSSSSAGDPVQAIARETGAQVVIAGSIYQVGDSITFESQVVDVENHRVLGNISRISAPLAHPIAGLSELRSRLVGLVVGSADRELTTKRNFLPPRYEAYQAYAIGLDLYLRGNWREAASQLKQAAVLDSTFVVPLLFASICHSNLEEYARADSLLDRLDLNKAKLNQYDRSWLEYRRAFLAGNHPAALAAIREAAAEAPGTKATYNWGVEALQSGYVDEALKAFQSLAPDHWPMRGWSPYMDALGAAYHLRAEFSRELEVGIRARSMYPTRAIALAPFLRALSATGDLSRLETAIAPVLQSGSSGRDAAVTNLVREAAEELSAHGNPRPAADLFERVLSIAGPEFLPLDRANVLLRLGKPDSAAAVAKAALPAAIDSTDYLGFIGIAAALRHDSTVARRIIDQLLADRQRYRMGGPRLAAARIAAAMGDSAVAVGFLRRAFAEGWEYDLWLHRDPTLERLAGYAPFDSLTVPKRVEP